MITPTRTYTTSYWARQVRQGEMCNACPAGRNGRYDCPDIISADSKGFHLSNCRFAKWVAGEATDDTSGK